MQASASRLSSARRSGVSVASRSASPERSTASATHWQPVSHSSRRTPLGDAGALAGGEEGAPVRLRRERAPRGQRREETDQDRLMDEIDRQAVPAGEAYARAPAPTWRANGPAALATSRTPGKRATPRPRKTTPAHGRSGRQSSVLGSASPRPSHRSQGGSNRVERPSHGATIAAKPDREAGPGRRGHERRGDEARDRDAMQNAEGDGFAGREDEAARGHQRRRAGDDREAAPEGSKVKPVTMGERQRHADQGEEHARHNMGQKPHLRRERQHGRGKPKVGEVPAEVVDGHADERQAARAIDRVDAARALARAVVPAPLRRSRRRGFEQGFVESERALVFDRAGHQHMVVGGAPLDDEVAARQTHRPFAVHEPKARRSDQGRAGGRAAGERQPDPALPHPRLDVVPGKNLRRR